MQFKRLLILASLVITSYAQTSVVEDDINNHIAPALDSLLSAIDAFPTSNGTVMQALLIHEKAIDLNTTLVDTTNDMKNETACKFETSDAKVILDDLRDLLPNIQQFLTDIVARSAALKALPSGVIPGIVKNDLNLLSQDTDTLASSFMDCAPAVIPAVEELMSKMNDAFGPAMAAFA